MKYRRGGFTLTEMLVVLAIVAVLAAMLFPVFRSVRAASQRAVCVQNFRSAHAAAGLYLGDYDDRFMPANYKPVPPRSSSNDRTWVQLLLPYTKNFAIFRCPSDYSIRPAPETTFDQDLVPGDTYSRYYSASLRANLGYNFMYLSPAVKVGNGWVTQPRLQSQVNDVSRTLLFADSVWNRTDRGMPEGGGSWIIVPPCRYADQNGVDSFKVAGSGEEIYTASYFGWDTTSQSGPKYGGAWPWHNGRLNVLMLGGNASPLVPDKLSDGCALGNRWSGYINNSGSYMWDLN